MVYIYPKNAHRKITVIYDLGSIFFSSPRSAAIQNLKDLRDVDLMFLFFCIGSAAAIQV